MLSKQFYNPPNTHRLNGTPRKYVRRRYNLYVKFLNHWRVLGNVAVEGKENATLWYRHKIVGLIKTGFAWKIDTV